MWPPGLGHFMAPGAIFKFSSQKSIFSLCDLEMQWMGTIWTIIKEGHIRIISAKFGKNPASSLGDVLWSNRWWRIMEGTCPSSNNHNSSTWADGSGELKKLNQTHKLIIIYLWVFTCRKLTSYPIYYLWDIAAKGLLTATTLFCASTQFLPFLTFYIYCTWSYLNVMAGVLCTCWFAGLKPTSNHILITVGVFNLHSSIGCHQLTSRSDRRCTDLESTLQMKLRKVCSDTETFTCCEQG